MDIWGSFVEWWKERTSSPLYGAFIVSVILWNWQFFYILFLQNQGSLPVPAVEYAQTYFEGFRARDYLLHLFLLPSVSTALLTLAVPFIANKIHEASLYFYFQRKRAYHKASLGLEKEKEKELELLASIKKKQAISKEEIAKNTTPDDRLEQSFQEFIKTKYVDDFKRLLIIIYENQGWIMNSQGKLSIPSESLAVIHSNGLIEFREDTRRAVDLTEKGRAFASKLLN